ncbi:MAG: O-antigen polymerase [Patescibacteria group bacterium]|jgi:oligosaccharide repeat unit polymerase
MILLIIFLILSISFGLSYIIGKDKFSPSKLLLSLWFMAIAVAQLRLSPYENPWTLKFWLILGLFFTIFVFIYLVSARMWQKKLKEQSDLAPANSKLWLILIIIMAIASIITNIYIFYRFGTLPILSSSPDKMRFIINRDIFGLWEYASLLPRLFIPLTFIYFLQFNPKKWLKALLITTIILGFILLSFYASRLVIIFPILICYFSYLIIKIKEINLKKIILASVSVVVVVLAISIAIPAFRQSITYRDYLDPSAQDDPFGYIAKISGLRIPKSLNFIVPIYIIPSFNLQALMKATDLYDGSNFYYGKYDLAVFNPALKLIHQPEIEFKIPWDKILLPWWVTATFLFSYWIDFGYMGIILAGVFWGILLSGLYIWAKKKPSLLSVMLFAYFSFTVIMSIYTNYFLRPELYMDVVAVIVIGLIARAHKFSPKRFQ